MSFISSKTAQLASTVIATVFLSLTTGCTEPTLGAVCSIQDPSQARQLVRQEPGRTNIALESHV